MLITLKTLLQQTFQIEFDEELTVKDLKKRVQDERGPEFPAESLKLIYAGKILEDAEQIKEYKIDVKKFIVVMKTKPTEAPQSPAKSAVDASQAASSTPAQQTEVKVSTTTESSEVGAAASSTDENLTHVHGTFSESAGSGLMLVGDEYESVVKNIMELGYSRRLVEKALRLSYNNPDRACDYLINQRITEDNVDQIENDEIGIAGIEDYLNFGEGIQVPGAIGSELRNARLLNRSNVMSPQSTTTNPENEPLAFLRSQPQFHQMRQIIQQNPLFLNTVLQQIGVSNPALLKLISENQVAFVNMINEPINNNNNDNTNNNRNVASSINPIPASAVSAAAATTTPAAAVTSSVAREERMEGVQESDSTAPPSSDPTANDALYAATLASTAGNEEEDVVQEVVGSGGADANVAAHPFNLTESDLAAINRIKELGFSEMEVVQAYIACDKDENRTADFLLSE